MMRADYRAPIGRELAVYRFRCESLRQIKFQIDKAVIWNLLQRSPKALASLELRRSAATLILGAQSYNYGNAELIQMFRQQSRNRIEFVFLEAFQTQLDHVPRLGDALHSGRHIVRRAPENHNPIPRSPPFH